MVPPTRGRIAGRRSAFRGKYDEEHIAGCGDAKSARDLTDHYAQKSDSTVDDATSAGVMAVAAKSTNAVSLICF
ncbi:MAG: hypothetical protein WB774_14430 [Xanthobacteraceae bacterium]|jgi:hypothetical protein